MRFEHLDVDALVLAAQKPSRYVGGEVNSVAKDLRAMRATWALCFPDTYEVGMSNVGFRLLYHLLNRRSDVACERAFMPWPDMAALQRERGVPLWSLDSRVPVRDFDILGFSLQFEACYTTCLEMLDLAGVPLFSSERTAEHPLVIAGGPCAYNGEPVAPFFDVLVLGDGEEVALEITDAVIGWKAESPLEGRSREELLRRLAKIQGVYVPSFFEVVYAKSGEIERIVPKVPGYERVERRVVRDLNLVPWTDRPIVPFMQTVHDRLPLELQRGCVRGCRFCQVGMLSRPVRQRDPRQVLEQAETGLAATGYEEIGFLSLSAGDYGCLNPLLEDFFKRFGPQKVAISLPSLRTETMSDELATQIGQVKKTGFTIAPEAATDRLRAAINKGNAEENLLRAIESVFRNGWSMVKLYFMIGLPTETDADVLAIAELAKKALRQARQIRPDVQITVSVSTFVPKPFTPFQWEPMIPSEETIRRHNLLRGAFPRRGPLALKYHEAKTSLLEGALARGDRRVATAIYAAWKRGQVLDGWTEHFNYARWVEAFDEAEREHGVGLAWFSTRERSESEVLPWDHLDPGVRKPFLLKERARSRAGQALAECVNGPCGGCGACDFKEVTNRVYRPGDYVAQGVPCKVGSGVEESGATEVAPAGGTPALPAGEVVGVPGGEAAAPSAGSPVPRPVRHHVRVRYAKLRQAIAVSHLETMNVLLRAVRRSGLPVVYSQGFSPRPRVSLGPACPVGIETRAEYFDLELHRFVEPDEVVRVLGAEMPRDFPLLEAAVLPPKALAINNALTAADYRATFPASVTDEQLRERIAAFASAERLDIVREKRKAGRCVNGAPGKSFDVKESVLSLELAGPRQVAFRLRARIEGSVRPLEALTAVFGSTEGVKLLKESLLLAEAPEVPVPPAA